MRSTTVEARIVFRAKMALLQRQRMSTASSVGEAI